MSKGYYIGGNTVIRDPACSGRLARKLRKTRQTEKRRALERERFEASLKAYEASNPQSVLIKKCGRVVDQVVGTDELDGRVNMSSNQLERGIKKEKLKFHGPLQNLMHALTGLGISGDWQKEPNGVWQFRCPR